MGGSFGPSWPKASFVHEWEGGVAAQCGNAVEQALRGRKHPLFLFSLGPFGIDGSVLFIVDYYYQVIITDLTCAFEEKEGTLDGDPLLQPVSSLLLFFPCPKTTPLSCSSINGEMEGAHLYVSPRLMAALLCQFAHGDEE
jgi:hypothetical protein